MSLAEDIYRIHKNSIWTSGITDGVIVVDEPFHIIHKDEDAQPTICRNCRINIGYMRVEDNEAKYKFYVSDKYGRKSTLIPVIHETLEEALERHVPLRTSVDTPKTFTETAILAVIDEPDTEDNVRLIGKLLHFSELRESLENVINQKRREMNREITELKRQVEQFENQSEYSKCIICYENAREILFSPCNHFVCCQSCSEIVDNCPGCRELLENKIKVFSL